MDELTYEDFLEEVWDYVPEYVVSDDYWENNQTFIRELTYDLYQLYKKSIIKTSYNDVIFNPLSQKVTAKLIEIFFINTQKHKVNG